MKKFILVLALFSKFIFTSETRVCTLPQQKEVFAILSECITSWSELTLRELSQELAHKSHSESSLNDYLLMRMLGDKAIICPEITSASTAIIQKSNKQTN